MWYKYIIVSISWILQDKQILNKHVTDLIKTNAWNKTKDFHIGL
jgi:hypothetical protein